ncbi:MAG: CPBP family intramembrane metalloprotease [Clostridiales bacterium]|nr:CPBP family intramembrane metalloprotease [Clostridiales bacterium]
MLNKTAKTFDYCGACTFYLGAILVTLVGQALISVVSVMFSQSYPDIATDGNFLTACMIVLQAANALFIVLFCKVNKRRFDCALALRRDSKKVDCRDFILPVIAALVLLAAMYLPTVWYGYFTTYALHISPTAGNIELDTASSIVMIVIASVFLAPVFEESIYRGVLFNGLKKNKSAVKAVLLSALAFMLMHMSPIQVVFQFALGVLSAVIMNRTGRLLPSVLLHATANAAALAIQFRPLSNVISGCMAWLVANPVAAVFITLAFALAGGAVLFVIVRFGYVANGTENADEQNGEAQTATPETVANEARAEARSKDGTVRFWIATAVSGVLFIINLITMIAG